LTGNGSLHRLPNITGKKNLWNENSQLSKRNPGPKGARVTQRNKRKSRSTRGGKPVLGEDAPKTGWKNSPLVGKAEAKKRKKSKARFEKTPNKQKKRQGKDLGTPSEMKEGRYSQRRLITRDSVRKTGWGQCLKESEDFRILQDYPFRATNWTAPKKQRKS